MRLKGIRRSRNVEVRGGRGGGARKGGLGIVGVIAVLAIGYFTGIDVSSLVGGTQNQSGAPASQADSAATQFSAQVLTTTEDVWGNIFP